MNVANDTAALGAAGGGGQNALQNADMLRTMNVASIFGMHNGFARTAQVACSTSQQYEYACDLSCLHLSLPAFSLHLVSVCIPHTLHGRTGHTTVYVSLPLFLLVDLSRSIAVGYHRLLFSLSLCRFVQYMSLCMFPLSLFHIFRICHGMVLYITICTFPLPLIFPLSIYFCVCLSVSSLFFLLLFFLVRFLLGVSLHLPTFPSPNILIPYGLHGTIIHIADMYGASPFAFLFVAVCPLSPCHIHCERPTSFVHDFGFNMRI